MKRDSLSTTTMLQAGAIDVLEENSSLSVSRTSTRS